MTNATDTYCRHNIVELIETIEDDEPIHECRTCKQHFYLRRKSTGSARRLSTIAGPGDDPDLDDI